MIVGVTMVRDEADIIPYSLARMLEQVDYVIAADNGSVDDTRDILDCFDRVTVIDDPEPGYWQADKMTRLAHQAGAMGATWVVPFDADEAWTLPNLAAIDGNVVYGLPYVYVPQPSDDPGIPNPLERIQHRQYQAEPFPKVLFRYHPDARLEQGNHSVWWPDGGWQVAGAKVRHYQYRSLEQVARKVRQGTAAYRHTTLPKTEGAHWRALAALTDDQLAAWWAEYIAQPVVRDP